MNEKTIKLNITLTLHPPPRKMCLCTVENSPTGEEGRDGGVLEVDTELAMGRELEELACDDEEEPGWSLGRMSRWCLWTDRRSRERWRPRCR